MALWNHEVLLDELTDVLVVDAVEAVAAPLHELDLVAGDPHGSLSRCIALEERAQLVEIDQIVCIVCADDCAAVRRRLDQAFRLEHQERFADRCPADPELPRQLLFLEPGTGLEPPVENRLADQLRRRNARVLDEPPTSLEDPRHESTIQYANRPLTL